MTSIIVARRKKKREAARRFRERTKQGLERLGIVDKELAQLKEENNILNKENLKLKMELTAHSQLFHHNAYFIEQNINQSASNDRPRREEGEWKKEFERKKILNERNSLLDFTLTHDCASSLEHQQQCSACSNASASVPLYQASSCGGNAQPFCYNHDYAVEQAQMLPRPIGFCLNDYKEWEKPATNQNANKPSSQDQSTQPKYSTFPEFLAAKTGFTPASGRYTPVGKIHFWNLAISPLSSARGQPITPVFDSGVRECKKNLPLSEVGSVDENK